MAYPIPSWLEVTPAQFGSAAAQGAEISLGRARLQEEARQANMRMAMQGASLAAESKAREDEMRRKEQEAAISHQYEQAQIGLRTRAQQQAEEEFGFTVQQTALKSAAQREAQARIQAGEDPSTVWRELGPQAGITGAGLTGLTRKQFTPGLPFGIPGLPGYTGIMTSESAMRLLPERAAMPTEIKGVPVRNPSTGKIEEGMIGFESPSGGYTVHNIPQESSGAVFRKVMESKMARGESGAPAPTSQKALTPEKAAEYLEKAGYDRARAEQMARDDGWEF